VLAGLSIIFETPWHVKHKNNFQTDCKKGPDSDKPAFTAWVRELSAAFKEKGFLLSTAVSASKTIIDAGYDVPELSTFFDWIAIMAYDFHGQWDKKTGHVAPLYYHEDDDVSYFNAVLQT
jgi:chitinase